MQTTPSLQLNTLQPDLIKLVKALQEDLRQRCDEVAEVQAPLLAEYGQAQRAGRTQETFGAWREHYLNQVAVAWVLASVFVRYLEDQGLVEECWLAGQGARRAEARERYSAFFRAHPEWSDREYVQHVFERVAALPGCHDLFARDRNPLWRVGISGDGAKKLREFFAEVDPASGQLLRSFEGADTRFLGDLYQNLSEEAQKKYALLQTPEFVEEFILDRTLDPALAEFGLEQVKMIDPTCGSGHFLLGGFARLLAAWQAKSHENIRVLARRALEAVHGVDINPFAVAIARFRLVIAYLRACGFSRLAEMPDVKIHVATGDSLLHGNTLCSARGWGVHELFEWLPEAYASGDFEDASQILSQRYEAVVGNPPYIVDRDKAHNNAVRSRYKTAYRQFSLAVPFKEKFWDLAVEAKGPQRAGFIGMITANSFMKREFGTRLIEEFFPQVDLTHVLHTSGAYIPGHGTPTLILLGRNRAPVRPVVRAVLGIRGEPNTPADPAQGQVWRSIVDLVDQPGAQNAFVSVADFDRATFGKHPWPSGGGGASELKDKIDRLAACKLKDTIRDIGFGCMTRADEVYFADPSALTRVGIQDSNIVQNVEGDKVRDFCILDSRSAVFPYTAKLQPLPEVEAAPWCQRLWPYKELLWQRQEPNGDHRALGLTWYEWSRFIRRRYEAPLSIAFAEVATHNHFVLDRGGKVFNQTAPIIKLPEGAGEDDHLALLGLLNSAAGNFWVRQVCVPKGGDYVGNKGARVIKTVWADRLQRDGTKIGMFPIPPQHTRVLPLARELDQLAGEYASMEPCNVLPQRPPEQWQLAEREQRQREVRARMVALQEELDWLSYQLYGILDEAPLATQPPPLQLGERAFEIALARSQEDTTWFTRHGSTPQSELPGHWPVDYRQVVEQRLALMANHAEIQLLEKPEHKRRWQQQAWDERVKAALQQWLGDRLEEALKGEDQLISASQLADRLAHDGDFLRALALWLGHDDFDLSQQASALALPQAVPYLAAWRYTESGLRVRADWEATWALQRRQDAGEEVGDIAVPPKYGQKDFARLEYWSLRGKLDVPKERFISYPGAEREADGSPLLGWAGWNHLQRAQALASYVVERREEEGWGRERLTPLLAGLAELLPWLKQWHNELDPHTGERLGDYFEAFLGEQMRELELTPRELSDWRPAVKTGRGKGKRP